MRHISFSTLVRLFGWGLAAIMIAANISIAQAAPKPPINPPVVVEAPYKDFTTFISEASDGCIRLDANMGWTEAQTQVYYNATGEVLHIHFAWVDDYQETVYSYYEAVIVQPAATFRFNSYGHLSAVYMGCRWGSDLVAPMRIYAEDHEMSLGFL